jgi:hypothetical protein
MNRECAARPSRASPAANVSGILPAIVRRKCCGRLCLKRRAPMILIEIDANTLSAADDL